MKNKILAGLFLLPPFVCVLISLTYLNDTHQVWDGYVNVTTKGGNGSGTIIKHEEEAHHNYILTAFHIIAQELDENGEITVKFFKRDEHGRITYSEEVKGYIVDYSKELDYAIIIAQSKERYPAVKTAHRDTIADLAPGQDVVSVGAPLEETMWVTYGKIANPFSNTMKNHIGHESKIFFGNSGGPLYNIDGEQIAMNVRIGAAYNNFLPQIAFALGLDKIYDDLGLLKTKRYFGQEK